MNKECKHKELQNLLRIQDRPRRNNIHIDGLAESPNENWKDTENKLHQKLCDYLGITEGVVMERANRVTKGYKLKQAPRTIVAKLLNYKDKE